MARLEHRDVLERVHQDFLNDVAGVERPARARRQTAAGRSVEAWKVARAQLLPGVWGARAGAQKQLERGLVFPVPESLNSAPADFRVGTLPRSLRTTRTLSW
jgi:hypothetical protein